MPHTDRKTECDETCIIKFNFGSRCANIISDSTIMLVLLVHNLRSLTPSWSLGNTIFANYGVRVLCLSRCTVKHQWYKGDFPVPVSREINHGLATPLPAAGTMELIAFT